MPRLVLYAEREPGSVPLPWRAHHAVRVRTNGIGAQAAGPRGARHCPARYSLAKRLRPRRRASLEEKGSRTPSGSAECVTVTPSRRHAVTTPKGILDGPAEGRARACAAGPRRRWRRSWLCRCGVSQAALRSGRAAAIPAARPGFTPIRAKTPAPDITMPMSARSATPYAKNQPSPRGVRAQCRDCRSTDHLAVWRRHRRARRLRLAPAISQPERACESWGIADAHYYGPWLRPSGIGWIIVTTTATSRLIAVGTAGVVAVAVAAAPRHRRASARLPTWRWRAHLRSAAPSSALP
jgi:hypothetical protein